VPIEVRRALGLHAGDALVFELQGDEIRVRIEKRRGLSDLRGALPATRPFPGRDAVRVETARRMAEETGELRLRIAPLVLAETVWVLLSLYGYSPGRVVEELIAILRAGRRAGRGG
jgi:antitoxin PrlF